MYKEISEQGEKVGIDVSRIDRSDSKLQMQFGQLELADRGLRLNYEGYEYEIYYCPSNQQTFMFNRSQPSFTIAGDIRMTVQMMMQEIKSRASARG